MRDDRLPKQLCFTNHQGRDFHEDSGEAEQVRLSLKGEDELIFSIYLCTSVLIYFLLVGT